MTSKNKYICTAQGNFRKDRHIKIIFSIKDTKLSLYPYKWDTSDGFTSDGYQISTAR